MVYIKRCVLGNWVDGGEIGVGSGEMESVVEIMASLVEIMASFVMRMGSVPNLFGDLRIVILKLRNSISTQPITIFRH